MSLLPNAAFWSGRRVFLTGHSGFKGRWMTAWLRRMGADVTGYSIDAMPDGAARDHAGSPSVLGDVLDAPALQAAMAAGQPEVVFHFAAQSLVGAGYAEPVNTYAVNVMGTVNVLQAVRDRPSVKAAIVVTSDKCYENREWIWPYREIDALGGRDPYSNSKACAELVAQAYRQSFLAERAGGAVGTATVRAGNVIGAGDWSASRIVPDLIRGFLNGQPAPVRQPRSVRPWQHVVEPLCGYLLLAERLHADPAAYAEAWNFGPSQHSERPVSDLADTLCGAWGAPGAWSDLSAGYAGPHEAGLLKLDSRKAADRLAWSPRFDFEQTIAFTADGYRRLAAGEMLADVMDAQIEAFSQV